MLRVDGIEGFSITFETTYCLNFSWLLSLTSDFEDLNLSLIDTEENLLLISGRYGDLSAFTEDLFASSFYFLTVFEVN